MSLPPAVDADILDALPGEPPPQAPVFHDVLPPFPGDFVLPLVRVPGPPPVPEDSDEAVLALWRLHVGWCSRAFGTRARDPRYITIDDARTMRYRRTLARAAEELRAARVTPVAYLLNAAPLWRGVRARRYVADAPVLAWTFGAPTVPKVLARIYGRTTPAPQRVMLPVHHSLIRRWEDAALALRRLAPSATRADAMAAVFPFFGPRWAEEVVEGVAQVKSVQARLDEAVMAGMWVWR